jgi:ADP-ribosylglycohydrolase
MRDQDRAVGAYVGAAIGDAMGGPVEASHAYRIRRLVGEITSLLPYEKPHYQGEPHPGGPLQRAAGSVTDDTFIRGDFTPFLLAVPPPRTPDMLVDWLLQHARFVMWWPPMIEGLRRVQRGEVKAEEGGLTFFQGGGIGYWTPIGILHAGQPARAAAETANLSRIWKAPLEQDLAGAVQAAVAAGLARDATADSMVEAMLSACRSLGRSLIQRAVDIARSATDVWDLIDKVYAVCLMPELKTRHLIEPTRDADGPMPPITPPSPDTDEPYLSSFYAEQVPLAVAAFVFARGEPHAICVAAQLGRDADSVATTVGSWVGALHGESGLPQEWVSTVRSVNMGHMDIGALAERAAALAA